MQYIEQGRLVSLLNIVYMLHMPFDNVTLYVEHHFSTVSGTIPFIVIDQSPVGECVSSPFVFIVLPSRVGYFPVCLCVLTVDTSTLNICYQCRALWVIPPWAMHQELTALELFHWNTFSVWVSPLPQTFQTQSLRSARVWSRSSLWIALVLSLFLLSLVLVEPRLRQSSRV